MAVVPLGELEGHTERVVCLALDPDAETLMTGSLDDTLRVWQVPSGSSAAAAAACGSSARRSSDSSSSAATTAACKATCKVVSPIMAARFALTPGSRAIVVASVYRIRVVDLASMQERLGWESRLVEVTRERHGATYTGVLVGAPVVSPDGRFVLVAAAGVDPGGYRWDVVEQWELQTGALVGLLEGHEGEVLSLVVTRDNCLVSTSKVRGKCVWGGGPRGG